ncbi:MAG: hypothetical protein H6905_00885 [Hyphomicrobiales bacterium]|nr:hypothetical protein [Hyphomicrobiales bacterium]
MQAGKANNSQLKAAENLARGWDSTVTTTEQSALSVPEIELYPPLASLT